MRVDIWDVQAAKDAAADIDCGYPRNFSDKFRVDYVIGKGGFGTVRAVTDVLTGVQYACKTVRKRLDVPNVSVAQQAKHIDNLKREISILRKLRGTLSVVHFKGAYEDNDDVHIVMEYCRGGELHHRIGKREYNEKTVQRIMKCCMFTLAQCHSHNILHRDIKPGNFMWLTDEEDSPVKALDFGLAVYFKPDELPRTDLGLEGTPWFMAPETLSSEVWPASDVWAAGVMAYQLLSGYLPFDDRRNPNAPALSIVWKAILTEQPKLSGSAWSDISDQAKSFVSSLLVKDPAQRPTAKEALQHPWLFCEETMLPSKPISHSVVQRIQRYCQGNMVRRSILELIAQELLELLRAAEPSVHGGRSLRGGINLVSIMGRRAGSTEGSVPDTPAQQGAWSPPQRPTRASDTLVLQAAGAQQPAHGASPFAAANAAAAMPSPPAPSAPIASSWDNHGAFRLESANSRDLSQLDEDEFREEIGRRMQRRVNSVHGGTEFFKARNSSKDLAARAASLSSAQGPQSQTTHGSTNYFRVMRAAATLLNTGKRPMSVDGSGPSTTGDYLRYVGRTEEERCEQAKARRLALDTSAHGGEGYSRLVKQLSHRALDTQLESMLGQHPSSFTSASPPPTLPLTARLPKSPEGSACTPPPHHPTQGETASATGSTVQPPPLEEQASRGKGAFKALMEAQGHPLGGMPAAQPQASAAMDVDPPIKHVRWPDEDNAAAPVAQHHRPAASSDRVLAKTLSDKLIRVAEQEGDRGVVSHPKQLSDVLQQLSLSHGNDAITREELGAGLAKLGFVLEDSELNALMDQLDLNKDGVIGRSEFLASQMDWGVLQEDCRDLWLQCAQRAFAALDTDRDGKLSSKELIEMLRSKLPAHELDWALEDMMIEAGYADADEVDFEGFLRMAKAASHDALDSLDQYEARLDLEQQYAPGLEPLQE